jgi:hypothetical protein
MMGKEQAADPLHPEPRLVLSFTSIAAGGRGRESSHGSTRTASRNSLRRAISWVGLVTPATDVLVETQVDPTHNHPFDPADELSVAPTEADVATPHPSAADKPVEERWPIPAPPPGYQGESYEATVGPDGVTVFVPPEGTGSYVRTPHDESGDSVLGIPAKNEKNDKNEKRPYRTHREGDHL